MGKRNDDLTVRARFLTGSLNFSNAIYALSLASKETRLGQEILANLTARKFTSRNDRSPPFFANKFYIHEDFIFHDITNKYCVN